MSSQERRLGGPARVLLVIVQLDELPQFVNVLKGEMSLVGPRPLHAEYLKGSSSRRKAGHQGLAQISGRNALRWEERLGHDVHYVDHASLHLGLTSILDVAPVEVDFSAHCANRASASDGN